MRVLYVPSDIDGYPTNQLIRRKFRFRPGHPQLPSGGEVVECEWGEELDSEGASVHPAESVCFTRPTGGSWAKTTSLSLG